MNCSLRPFARTSAFFLCSFAALFLSVPACPGQSSSKINRESGDLILMNGKIITVDTNDSIAQALAIHDGKIAAVGTNEEIRKRSPKNARVIDLHGRTATPGLIDSHCHFDETAAIYGVQLSKITKISEAVDLVRQKVATQRPGEWITGSGWDEGKLAESRYITAADLDKVAPNHPVWLAHTTGHYGAANSFALRLAKISPETKDPKGGTIDRDANGLPTGVLKEEAMSLVTSLIPPYTKDQQRNGLLKMMADFNSEGMTAAKDPGTEGERWDLYRELLQQNKSTVRIFASWSPLASRLPVCKLNPSLHKLSVMECCSREASNSTIDRRIDIGVASVAGVDFPGFLEPGIVDPGGAPAAASVHV
jgi:predicted amidohydrolase YtcJ